MTPREHLAVLLSYLEDLTTVVHESAKYVDDEEAYAHHTRERVFSEAQWVATSDYEPDEEADEGLVEAYLPEVERLITQLT